MILRLVARQKTLRQRRQQKAVAIGILEACISLRIHYRRHYGQGQDPKTFEACMAEIRHAEDQALDQMGKAR